MTGFDVLGVIPVRGGSKGVPRKNIRPLAGRPLLAYTIDAAKASVHLGAFVVSTEDPEIAAVAEELGAGVVPRPQALAGDSVPMCPVIQDVLRRVESQAERRFDAVFTLQATTPFRSASDIDRSIEMLAASNADSVIGVVRIYDGHPARIKKIVNGRLEAFCVPEDEQSRRQDLEPAYLRNGAVYLTRRAVVDSGSLRGTHQLAYEMPPERSINIDERLDFLLAEAVLGGGHLTSP